MPRDSAKTRMPSALIDRKRKREAERVLSDTGIPITGAVRTGNDPFTYELSDWAGIFEVVREARFQLKASTVWFRGHTDARFSLVPGLFRVNPSNEMAFQAEKKAFETFERLAPRFAIERKRDWHTLVDMQHYGIPTRLLDWTSVLGLAVFFATSRYGPSQEDPTESAIYVLNPRKLNSLVGRAEVYSSEDDSFSYRSIYWEQKPFLPSHPIALETPFVNDRIYAQQGLFTVHNDGTPLENQPHGVLCKIVLKPSCVSGAREFLEYSNINEVTVFPDIQGLVAYVRSQMSSVQLNRRPGSAVDGEKRDN